MLEYLMRGGPFMYLILMLAVVLLVFGVLHVVLARRWTLIVTLILFVLAPLAGVLGYLYGASMVEGALAAVDPARRDELAAVGYAEAKIALHFGLGVGGVGLVPLVIGEVRRRRR